METSVVVYEDNALLREGIAGLVASSPLLRLAGAFESCTNVTEDMKRLMPDVVLMDIDLPGINGIEGLKLIRKNFPHIHVIMLTVFEDDTNIFNAICEGATGYLLKKTPPDKIPESIIDVMNGGAPMTSSIARRVLALFPKAPSSGDDFNKLSSREQEVLQLLINGHSYKMIAEKCSITLETVRSHIKRIYEKLRVHSATEAAARVFQRKS
jgi:DNA-binding NarL/FixJ family response regulator